jgi:hypothetical protein
MSQTVLMYRVVRVVLLAFQDLGLFWAYFYIL